MSPYIIGQIVMFIFYLSPWALIYLLYRFLKVYQLKKRSDEELFRKLEDISNQIADVKNHLNYKV
ncbi:hypothetical protein [Paenibacillus sp. GP183]|uniref:hypothetical protein n=1 Tax=Paenibacillus sp. GP183 TaxID=1882751 RepID=UPI0008964AF6|nr:hypothetical protein [Paenibacillus sp. GP183]SEB58166.1 hypothetical protein SAMN05443246_1182 [Paenibacillus sp. GP183]